MKTEKLTFEITELDAVFQCTVCGEEKCIFILPGGCHAERYVNRCPAGSTHPEWLPYQKGEGGGA